MKDVRNSPPSLVTVRFTQPINIRQLGRPICWSLRTTSLHKSLIVGNTASGWKPARNNASKYFIPEEQFRGDVYPTFVTGPSYVVSKAGTFTTVNHGLKN